MAQLTLERIQAETRETTVTYLGDELHLTYRPGVVTPANDVLPAAAWIPLAVVAWDLTADREPYPIDAEHIAKLPDAFLLEIAKQVIRHAALDPFTNGTSADG